MVLDIGNNRTIEIFDSINYTYNVAPMYYRAFQSFGEEENKGIRKLENLTGEEAKPLLEEAIEKMKGNIDAYKILNPKNGWGTYEGVLSILTQLLRWAEYAPKARFHIS